MIKNLKVIKDYFINPEQTVKYYVKYLNNKHQWKSAEEKLRLSEQFIKGFICEEFIKYWLRQKHILAFTNISDGFSYEPGETANKGYTNYDAVINYNDNLYTVDFKGSTWSLFPTKKDFERMHDADYLIHYNFVDLTIRIYDKDGNFYYEDNSISFEPFRQAILNDKI